VEGSHKEVWFTQHNARIEKAKKRILQPWSKRMGLLVLCKDPVGQERIVRSTKNYGNQGPVVKENDYPGGEKKKRMGWVTGAENQGKKAPMKIKNFSEKTPKRTGD